MGYFFSVEEGTVWLACSLLAALLDSDSFGKTFFTGAAFSVFTFSFVSVTSLSASSKVNSIG